VIINFFMKNIPQAYRPSYLWFWPPLILGGFSNFCRYYTKYISLFNLTRLCHVY
jgi:hypothetical protein